MSESRVRAVPGEGVGREEESAVRTERVANAEGRDAVRKQASEYRRQIQDLREKLRGLNTKRTREAVRDFELTDATGPVRLSELFGAHDTLFVVHNMGSTCNYCTLWADGLNGVIAHLQSRAAFVISSPESPQQQQSFAASRGWSLRMVSTEGTSFARDLGYETSEGMRPGVSVLRRDADGLFRVSDTEFGPYDDFCALWHLFDLLPEGADGWQPMLAYSEGH